MMAKRVGAVLGAGLVLFVAAGLVVQSVRTHQRNRMLRDSLSLWETGVEKAGREIRSLRAQEEALNGDAYSMEHRLRREGSIGEGERVIPPEAGPVRPAAARNR